MTSGVYKRTREHGEKISRALKKRYESEDAREQVVLARRGWLPAKGKKTVRFPSGGVKLPSGDVVRVIRGRLGVESSRLIRTKTGYKHIYIQVDQHPVEEHIELIKNLLVVVHDELLAKNMPRHMSVSRFIDSGASLLLDILVRTGHWRGVTRGDLLEYDQFFELDWLREEWRESDET
jgi:hypothetical protein